MEEKVSKTILEARKNSPIDIPIEDIVSVEIFKLKGDEKNEYVRILFKEKGVIDAKIV